VQTRADRTGRREREASVEKSDFTFNILDNRGAAESTGIDFAFSAEITPFGDHRRPKRSNQGCHEMGHLCQLSPKQVALTKDERRYRLIRYAAPGRSDLPTGSRVTRCGSAY
jgi:hypothetical protein